ncbi:hypothetical protein ACSBR1_013745 [Camellia fascicularis]
MEIVDPCIPLEHNTRSCIKDCIVSIMRIGVACSMESPTNRMEMGSVISELRKIRNTYMNEGELRHVYCFVDQGYFQGPPIMRVFALLRQYIGLSLEKTSRKPYTLLMVISREKIT